MKKLISIITAAAIAMSFTTAFAANTDNMQEVLVSVKSRIDVPEEMSEFESSTTHSDYTTQYHFEWENNESYMYVSCYDDGMITSYFSYDNHYEREPKMSKMSADEAKQIAEDFVKKINPDYPYEAVVGDNENASLYTSHRYFPVELYVNGVYLENHDGYVTVDTEKGAVAEFNIWYEPDTKEYFTGAEQFISNDAAQAAYTANFPMELVYRSYYDDDNNEVFYPVYTTTDNYNEYINAVTGEKETIDFYKNTMRAGGAGDMGDAEMATASSKANLTPQEIEELDNIGGLISKEDIEKQIRGNKILNIPADVKLNNINLYKNTFEDIYCYSISMSKNETDNYTSVYATVNAKTGEIINYDRNSYTGKAERDVVFINDDALKALAGEKADEYRFDENINQYVRYVNGIKVESNYAFITSEDGILTHYSIGYSHADFPSIDGVMSAEDAAKNMFEQTDYKPVCVAGYNADGEACLYPVYSLDDIQINPSTGKRVNWKNEDYVEGEGSPLEYSDISGHYAEKYITALAEYNIGFEGDEFRPDAKITQADLLTLLAAVTNGNSIIIALNNFELQKDLAYSNAVYSNIINEDERDDNAVITRETASIYLIRAIGAEQYAKYNDIYVTPFDDVTENKGYIALLSAMGVVNGDGGHFNPKREITRAEFAVMLYNYLNR